MVMSLIESLTRIKNAVYGREVREAIHDGVFRANQIADGAENKSDNTEVRQDALEIQTAQSVAQMEADKDAVIANATVDSEVILARGGKPTLKARLDETTEQLAQTIKVFNVKKYGAKGDGVTNDYLSFNNAVNDLIANGGGTLYIPKGSYILTDTIDITGVDVEIICDGKIIANEVGNKNVFTISGTGKNTSYLAKETGQQVDRIEVTDGTLFNIGDSISIKDGVGTWLIDIDRGYSKGQLSRIIGIEGNNLILDRMTFTDYGLNSTVKSYNLINVKIDGLDIVREYEDGSGIGVNYVDNCIIENVKIKNVSEQGISVNCAYGGYLKNNSIDGHGHSTTLGYGIAIYNSSDLVVENNKFNNGRRGVDLGGSTPSRHILVKNNTATYQSQSGFGSHAATQYCTFERNQVLGFTSTVGLDPRGRDLIITGNYMEVRSSGISLRHVAGNITIKDNYVNGKIGDYWTYYAVRILETPVNINEILIQNNYFESESATGCITFEGNLEKVNKVTIVDNNIKTRQLGATRHGIRFAGTTKIGLLKISNNTYHVSNNLTIDAGSEIDEKIIYGIEEIGIGIESGKNANGFYTKFEDGTLICWRNVNVDLTSTAVQAFNFPIDFHEFPSTHISASVSLTNTPPTLNDESSIFNSYIMARTDKGWSFKCDGSGLTTNFDRFVFSAIGRWKL